MIMQGSGLPGLDHANAIAKLEMDGSIIVLSGAADIGTGLDTIIAKVASDILCVPIERITVLSIQVHTLHREPSSAAMRQ